MDAWVIIWVSVVATQPKYRDKVNFLGFFNAF